MEIKEIAKLGVLLDDLIRTIDMNIYNRIKYESVKNDIEYQKLNYSQKMLMSACANNEMSMTQCAKLLGINTRSINRPVAQLEKMGYLKREQCPTNKKIFNVHLTEKGKSVIIDNSIFALTIMSVTTSKWSQEEYSEVVGCSSRLKELFSKLDYDPNDISESERLSQLFAYNKQNLTEKIKKGGVNSL